MARVVSAYVDSGKLGRETDWLDATKLPVRLNVFLRETIDLRINVSGWSFGAAETFRLVVKADQDDTDLLADSTTQSAWSNPTVGRVGMSVSLNTSEAIAVFASTNEDQAVWMELVRTTSGKEDIVASGLVTLKRDVLSGAEGTPTTATPLLPEQIDVAFYAPGNETIVLSLYAEYAATLSSIKCKTSTGTVTMAVQIDANNVTGASAIAVTTVEQTVTPTGANSVAIGNTVQIVLTNAANLGWLFVTAKLQR